MVTDIEVSEHDASGAAWDAFGGLPDPFACFDDGLGHSGCTSSCSDTTSCVPATGAISTTAGQPVLFTGAALKAGLTISVYDEDVSVNDLMGTTTGSVQTLSASGYSVPAFGGVISIAFQLQ